MGRHASPACYTHMTHVLDSLASCELRGWLSCFSTTWNSRKGDAATTERPPRLLSYRWPLCEAGTGAPTRPPPPPRSDFSRTLVGTGGSAGSGASWTGTSSAKLAALAASTSAATAAAAAALAASRSRSSFSLRFRRSARRLASDSLSFSSSLAFSRCRTHTANPIAR